MRRSAAYANFPPPLTLVSLFPSVEQFARHRVKQSTGIGSPVRGRARTALPLSLSLSLSRGRKLFNNPSYV